MVFDTDVLIWFLRRSAKAARAIDAAGQQFISVVTYMELIQGARDQREIRTIKTYLADLRFETLPLSENIGHRLLIYMEKYGLGSSLNKELQCHPFRS